MIGWFPDIDNTPLALVGGRLWLPNGVRRGDLLIKEGRIATMGEFKIPRDAQVIEIPDLLIAPGLIDADHPLADDYLPPLLSGPYADRLSREEDIERAQPAAWVAARKIAAGKRARAGAIDCLRNGVTAVNSSDAEKPAFLRPVKIKRIESLEHEKNPDKIFKKAGEQPVAVRLADGSNWNAAREFAKLADAGGIGANLLVVGGVALTCEQAQRLVASAAHLVWRPLVDRYVIGHTWSTDLVAAAGERLLLGAGSRRDGGKGLLATLQLAEKIGKMTQQTLIEAVTIRAAHALKLPVGELKLGNFGDLSVWRADDLCAAVFRHDRSALQMAIIGGQVVLTRNEWLSALPNRRKMKPVPGDDETLTIIEPPECFT